VIELGTLPKAWSAVELGECVEVHYGKALSEKGRVVTGRIPVIGSSGIVGKHNSALVEGPSLVIGRKGAAGRVHFVGESSWPIDTAYFIQPPDEFQIKWLYYYLGLCGLGQLDKSTAIPSLSRDDLYRVIIPIAPAAEQARVVDKLEELLSDLDAGVAELKALQEKLRQYRKSLLKSAVEGALTAQWRAEERKRNTPTETGAQLLQRILVERRARWEARQLARFKKQGKAPPKDWQKKYPEPVQSDVAGLPALPEGWVWATIDQLAQVGTGVTPLRSKSEYFAGGTIPWVTSGALNDAAVVRATEYVTELALTQCRLDIYPPGSLLVAMYGEGKTRGKCSELQISATINQAIAALVLELSAISCRAYVKAFLHNSYKKMRAQASGGVQPNLNLQIIKSIAVPLPPLDEQLQITSTLEEQFDQITQQDESAEILLKQSTAQRKNMFKAAFTGKLVPQDSSDEPAGALLERIRGKRDAGTRAPRIPRATTSGSKYATEMPTKPS
jgi:type I restriction enzyme S subunit